MLSKIITAFFLLIASLLRLTPAPEPQDSRITITLPGTSVRAPANSSSRSMLPAFDSGTSSRAPESRSEAAALETPWVAMKKSDTSFSSAPEKVLLIALSTPERSRSYLQVTWKAFP